MKIYRRKRIKVFFYKQISYSANYLIFLLTRISSLINSTHLCYFSFPKRNRMSGNKKKRKKCDSKIFCFCCFFLEMSLLEILKTKKKIKKATKFSTFFFVASVIVPDSIIFQTNETRPCHDMISSREMLSPAQKTNTNINGRASNSFFFLRTYKKIKKNFFFSSRVCFLFPTSTHSRK